MSNGIWIISDEKTMFCQVVNVFRHHLFCFSTDDTGGESPCIEMIYDSDEKTLSTKKQIDDVIMRGELFYKLEG